MFMGLIVVSCNKEQPIALTKAQINKKIDSLSRIQMQESNEQAKRDLEHRIKIEVKVKVDSILNAQQRLKTKDTSTKAAVPKKKPLF